MLAPQPLKPSRSISPLTAFFGIGMIGLGSMSLLLVDAVDTNARSRPVLWFGAAVVVAGLSLWRWEGRYSIRSQQETLREKATPLMIPKQFSFDETGWSMESEGSIDRREFEALTRCFETSSTFVLATDIVHLVPKRIFSDAELTEFRNKLPLPVQSNNEISYSTWDFFIAFFEYYWWRKLSTLILGAALPLIAVAGIMIAVHLNPLMKNFPSIEFFQMFCALIWYPATLVYVFVEARSSKRRISKVSFNAVGITWEGKALAGQHSWKHMRAARVGPFSFLIEPSKDHYFVLPKRKLSQGQHAMLIPVLPLNRRF
jgi:hypothetical protein